MWIPIARRAGSIACLFAFLVAPDLAGQGENVRSCTVRETSRQPLVVEGTKRLYVEADAFVADARGDVLLAGMPNLLIPLNASGRVASVTDDSVLGAVIPRQGSARVVPLPVHGGLPIDGIRAVARRSGGWGVGFAEMGSRAGETRPDSAVRLWYGVYDGRRWSRMEELPLPPGSRVDPHHASSLVQRGDTLWWAMTARTGPRPSIVIFQRHGGRWSRETIPTFHAAVQLGWSDPGGLHLLVVQPDTTLRSDGNSLFLWGREPGWRRLRRLVHGSAEGRVYKSSFTPSPAGGVVSWVGQGSAGQELRATPRLATEPPAAVVTLDSSITGFASHYGPVVLRSGFRIWVADHFEDGHERPELRFVSDSPLPASVIGQIPSPYLGFSAAVALGPTELLVTGLHQVPSQYIVSLLIRARVDCRGMAAR